MPIEDISPSNKDFEKDDRESTSVLIADDHPRVRSGIHNLLEKDPHIQVLGEACDGEEALRLVEELKPDVLLLDIEMPKMSGVEVAKKLQAQNADIKILVLSAYSEGQYIRNMMANGISGYLTKEEVPNKIVKAVRGVARGEEGWISRKVATQVGVWKQGKSSRTG